MEAQLAAYRARKAKAKVASQGSWMSSFRLRQTSQPSGSETSQDNFPKECEHPGNDDTTVYEKDTSYLTKNHSYFDAERLLKILLWICLLGAFVFLGLGGVFLLVSVFFVIYSSMGSDTRKEGELSAYSVFNPNCERLQGQLTAEQFERELKYGSGAT